jgi:hypothetical protein
MEAFEDRGCVFIVFLFINGVYCFFLYCLYLFVLPGIETKEPNSSYTSFGLYSSYRENKYGIYIFSLRLWIKDYIFLDQQRDVVIFGLYVFCLFET